jgi:hypothetical protein
MQEQTKQKGSLKHFVALINCVIILSYCICFYSQISMNVTVIHVMLMLNVQILLDLSYASAIRVMRVQDFYVLVSLLLIYDAHLFGFT